MNLLKASLLSLGLVFLVVNCGSVDTVDSNSVRESDIHTSYRAEFHEDKNDAEFRAQFRLGGSTGTTLKLIAPSKVTLDGQDMNLALGMNEFINVSGTRYVSAVPTNRAVGKHEFIWTKANGDKIATTVEIMGPSELRLVDPNAKLTAGNRVVFAANPLKDDEKKRGITLTAGVTYRTANGWSTVRPNLDGNGNFSVALSDLKEISGSELEVMVTRDQYISESQRSISVDAFSKVIKVPVVK